MKVTFGERGCSKASTDFDKLFFIRQEHGLHLCMGLMKEERALLCEAKLCVRARVRACALKQADVCSSIV